MMLLVRSVKLHPNSRLRISGHVRREEGNEWDLSLCILGAYKINYFCSIKYKIGHFVDAGRVVAFF